MYDWHSQGVCVCLCVCVLLLMRHYLWLSNLSCVFVPVRLCDVHFWMWRVSESHYDRAWMWSLDYAVLACLCVWDRQHAHTHTPVTFRLMVTCSGGHDAACVCPPVCVRLCVSACVCPPCRFSSSVCAQAVKGFCVFTAVYFGNRSV